MFGLLPHGVAYAWEDEDQGEEQAAVGATPPRLSFVDGQVSYWRSGASDWAQAQVNTPLAVGDQLYSGSPGNLELQIGGRAFVRAAARTQVGIENVEADMIQFKVTEGHASIDIQDGDDSSRTVEIDTPNATFLIEDPGYYKVNVNGENTTFSVHWSGQVTVTPAEGEAFVVSSDKEVRIQGMESPRISTSRASEPDQWDQWCLNRSDDFLHSTSSRYLSPDIYGASDLDRAGEWQETSDYGPVWLPTDTSDGWAPYTNGTWTNDPVYGWTWVDNEPWGWAPYHYGRWISLNGRWAWAPGPKVRRPAYAPALVAFFGNEERTGRSESSVGWVALGWGEPLVPWWGPERFHRPWWGGWGGPRVRHVERTGSYHNIGVHNALVVVHENRFGRIPIRSARVSGIDPRGFRPMPSVPIISRSQAVVMPVERRGIKPPDAIVERSVVSRRIPYRHIEATSPGQPFLGPTGRALPAPRIVNTPQPERVHKRIEVRQTLPNEQPSQPAIRQFRGEPVTSPPERRELKIQQEQQIQQQQQVREQQIRQQQIHQQQVQQQEQQQQVREQQIHQQQIQQQQQVREQQMRQQQIHQQQIQQQEQQQQIHQQRIQQQQQQQQVREQQIRQQQVHQQQIQQQQQQQQVREQQMRQQQIQQQQQQQIQQQQQQQVQQQQQKGPGPRPVKKGGGPSQQEEEQQVIIRRQ
jgi:hypothetical protein